MSRPTEEPTYFLAGMCAGAATPLAACGWLWAAAYCVVACCSLTVLAMLVEDAPLMEDHL